MCTCVSTVTTDSSCRGPLTYTPHTTNNCAALTGSTHQLNILCIFCNKPYKHCKPLCSSSSNRNMPLTQCNADRDSMSSLQTPASQCCRKSTSQWAAMPFTTHTEWHSPPYSLWCVLYTRVNGKMLSSAICCCCRHPLRGNGQKAQHRVATGMQQQQQQHRPTA